MRYLALDIGEKRTGLAISDASGRVASPVSVLPSNEVIAVSSSFRRILEDYQPEVLVAGLPISLDGVENQQAQKIRRQAEQIASALELPVVFADERLSTAQARRILRESGQSQRQMRGKTDKIAACLFLQGYLDGLH
jgi:putative Holliday junction resolvase